jgi:F0F1-type ATP synthase assembly protein I
MSINKNETKRNEINKNETKRNENEIKRNQRKQNEINENKTKLMLPLVSGVMVDYHTQKTTISPSTSSRMILVF